MTSIILKTNFNGDIRRFSFDIQSGIKFEALETQIRSIYGVSDFTLRYTDDEGDEITLTSSDEFKEAIRIAKFQKPPVLRVKLCNVKSTYKPTTKSGCVVTIQSKEKKEKKEEEKEKEKEKEKEEKKYVSIGVGISPIISPIIENEDKMKELKGKKIIFEIPAVVRIPIPSKKEKDEVKTNICDTISYLSAETSNGTKKEVTSLMNILNSINCDFSKFSDQTVKQAEETAKLTMDICKQFSTLATSSPSYKEGNECPTIRDTCTNLATDIARSTAEISKQARNATGAVADEIAFSSMMVDCEEKSTDKALKELTDKCKILFEETIKITSTESGGINDKLLRL